MQTNVILNATNIAGKKISTTITYLRDSQKDKAVSLAQALNALTTNTYTSTQVNEINILKSDPTLTVSQFQTGTSEYIYAINYTGDGDLFVNCTKPAIINAEKTRLAISATSSEDFSGTLYATETNNYYAKSITFTRNQ